MNQSSLAVVWRKCQLNHEVILSPAYCKICWRLMKSKLDIRCYDKLKLKGEFPLSVGFLVLGSAPTLCPPELSCSLKESVSPPVLSSSFLQRHITAQAHSLTLRILLAVCSPAKNLSLLWPSAFPAFTPVRTWKCEDAPPSFRQI